MKTPSTLTYRRRASALPFHLVSRVRRVLLGDGGAGALVGTGLLLAVGLALTYSAVRDIRAAVAPARFACGDFLAAPAPTPAVVLEGCRLDVARATVVDGVALVPVASPGSADLAVTTKDAGLLQLVASLAALTPEQVAASLRAREAELAPLLSPKTLRGSVGPAQPGGAGLVLSLDQETARLGALGRLVAGLLVMLVAFWPVARRFQLERELAAMAPRPNDGSPPTA